MRPLKPLVGLIGHSDFVSRESTFLQLEERGLKQDTLYYALFSGHATARLKACWRKILPACSYNALMYTCFGPQ